ncbi:UDP-N-acetylglucosamine 2-epimerase [Terasakiella sp.]|uniref:UDP-N-acetylglucosamine 2-epimerase n=1 Tax=Terasakiella sp. TaxID=2034861 RepID=UPI003AA92785
MTPFSKKKICVVTGTRAEYGLLSNLMSLLRNSPDFTLQLIVTGTHLSQKHGMTVNEIVADGYKIDEQVFLPFSGDTPLNTALMAAQALDGIAHAYSRLAPDLVILLGDRYEIASAAFAALYLQIPIAHIHGGERSEGVIDEAIRHSITKTANLHFTATELYRNRVLQLGEDPKRVFNVGALAATSIQNTAFLSRHELETMLGIEMQAPLFAITYHPISLSYEDTKQEITALSEALKQFPQATFVITGTNADTGASVVREILEEFVQSIPRKQIVMCENLGHKNYLSLVSHADVVIGNSSSGIIEAPILKIPSINIGDRQRGRMRTPSILDCSGDITEILAAIQLALNHQFRQSIKNTPSPYGNGNTAQKIINILQQTDWSSNSLKKTFFDITSVT